MKAVLKYLPVFLVFGIFVMKGAPSQAQTFGGIIPIKTCMALKVQSDQAYTDYQDALSDAESFSGTFSDCVSEWVEYTNSCSDYSDAYYDWWITCVYPTFKRPIVAETFRVKVEGRLNAMENDCALDTSDAIVNDC
jgi:hypothetical protein